jgi:hypothetical protein
MKNVMMEPIENKYALAVGNNQGGRMELAFQVWPEHPKQFG